MDTINVLPAVQDRLEHSSIQPAALFPGTTQICWDPYRDHQINA